MTAAAAARLRPRRSDSIRQARSAARPCLESHCPPQPVPRLPLCVLRQRRLAGIAVREAFHGPLVRAPTGFNLCGELALAAGLCGLGIFLR